MNKMGETQADESGREERDKCRRRRGRTEVLTAGKGERDKRSKGVNSRGAKTGGGGGGEPRQP